MRKVRIIPVFLFKNGSLVRSTRFGRHRVISDPFEQVRRINEWTVDEIVYLDISLDSHGSSDRTDKGNRNLRDSRSAVITGVADRCRVPLTWGGKLRSYGDVVETFARGADKVLFTTALDIAPEVISRTAHQYGRQAVAVGIDYRQAPDGLRTFIERGTVQVDASFESQVLKALDLGAGEILLHNIDCDGVGSGYDLLTLEYLRSLVPIPITVLGGARHASDLKVAAEHGADGLAAANMWHFTENVDVQVRTLLQEAGIPVRKA